jgi:non-ribosomal peptide synthetase component F
MRLISVGSEAWRAEDCRELLDLTDPDTVVVNAYGSTETTVDATVFRVTDPDGLRAGTVVPIGRPLPRTRVYVLDAGLGVLPAGVPGEICVGGAAWPAATTAATT